MEHRRRRRLCRKNLGGGPPYGVAVMKLRARSLVCAVKIVVYVLGVTGLACLAWGNTEYYRHVIFDNSLTSDAYFSRGLANGSSSLELKNGHLPVRDGRELPHRAGEE